MYPKQKDYTALAIAIIIGIPAVIFSAILSFGACEGCTLNIYLQNLNEALERLNETGYGLKQPSVYRELSNVYTEKFIFAGLLFDACVGLYIIAGRKNYIRGKEYGTDKYATVSSVNRLLRDNDKSNVYQYQYEKYTLLEKAAANIKCEIIRLKKRRQRRKEGVTD